MATMPTINYGSRSLEIPNGVITPMMNAGASRYRMEMGRDIQHSLDTASHAFFQIERIKDQADRRDAEYAMRQAQNWFDAEWYGRDEVDPQTGEKKHIAGVADRDYRAFEMDKTDSMKECARLKKEFRETDIYKNLSGGVKNHFDKQFAIYEGRLDNAAAENHRKLAAQKINVQNADKVKFVSGNVQRDFGANDATFENSASWGATQMTAMTLGSLVENSDEIAANPNVRVKDIVFRGGKRFDQLTAQEQKYVTDVFERSQNDFRKSRIKALSDAAASGRTLGGFATPEACLDKALEMTFVLNGAAYGFRPDGSKKGTGWLGTAKNSKGQSVSEFSFQSDAVKVGDKRVDIPMLVPGLTKEEVGAVMALSEGGKPDEKILASAQQKAVDHAKKQIAGGKSVWKDSGTGKEVLNDVERNEVLAYIDKSRKSLVQHNEVARTENYKNWQNGLGHIETSLYDPSKIAGLNFDIPGYAKKVAEDKFLSGAQKGDLVRQYSALAAYKDKYFSDLAKHNDAVKKAEDKQKSQYGWFNEDGAFVPASSFPDESAGGMDKEFNEEAANWQDPKTGMAKLEAARMTGRLSEKDYRRYYAYGTMMMDNEAKTWWFKNYGKFNIEGLTKTEYGETELNRRLRKLRESGVYSAASGIFASNKGVVKGYKNAADFVSDTLSKDKEDANESLVPLEVLPKVYETVRRFARAGVDPADAVRAILQPALQSGIERTIDERLSDPDYFNEVVNDFKEVGTHFYDTAIENAAAGKGVNWKADRDQAVTANLEKQGRVKVVKGK